VVMETARAARASLENLSARAVRAEPAGSAEESVVVNFPMMGTGTVPAAEPAQECGVVRSQAVAGAAQTAPLGW